MYIYISLSTCMCIYIYICIEREREREIDVRPGGQLQGVGRPELQGAVLVRASLLCHHHLCCYMSVLLFVLCSLFYSWFTCYLLSLPHFFEIN